MSSKKYEVKLTIPEINHVLELLSQNEYEEFYFGPYGQYWNRHNRIKEKMEEIKIASEKF